MFNFTVFQSGELFGHPAHHAMLDVISDDIEVTYLVMFSSGGVVYSSVCNVDKDQQRKEAV